LESGDIIDKPTIAYNTYGRLNENLDNVIFVCHALTANSDAKDWWSGLFGKGNVFDSDKYFIICPNNLGSPYGSSSPQQINPKTGERYGMDFPFFTIRDTAKLHLKLLDYLGISKIKLLIGGSCGGNICQEMAFDLQDQVENMALLCCSAVESAWVIAVHESQRIVLKTDKTLYEKNEKAGQSGLKACRAVALPTYRTHHSFKTSQKENDLSKLDDFKASSYIDYQGNKFVDRFDAHCYCKLLSTLDTHNIGRGRGSIENALSKIKINTVVIGLDTDMLIPTTEQKFLAEYLPNASYAEIKTVYGHDAFLIETDAIRAQIFEKIKL